MAELRGEQIEAYDALNRFHTSGPVRNSYFSLLGLAGTGKTFVLAEFVKAHPSESICVAAVAHKAKKQIYRRCRRPNVTPLSLAALLGIKLNMATGEFKPDYDAQRKEPIIEKFKIIIIDECSMITPELHKYAMDAKIPNTTLIYAGDEHQIRPIVKNSKLDGLSPTLTSDYGYRLTQRVRQGEGHPILEASDVYAAITKSPRPDVKKVKQGKNIENANGRIVFTDNLRNVVLETLPLYKQAVREMNTDLIKTVVYSNTKRKRVNKAIRKFVFDKEHDYDLMDYEIGDLLIMNNNYRVQTDGKSYDPDFDDPDDEESSSYTSVDNSDEFVLTGFKEDTITFNNIPPDFKMPNTWDLVIVEAVQLEKDFDEVFERKIKVPMIAFHQQEEFYTELERLRKFAVNQPPQSKEKQRAFMAWNDIMSSVAEVNYGYAITAHKSQGSTYDTVIVDVSDMLTCWNNAQEIAALIYTGMTRAARNCYMVNDSYTRTVFEPKPKELDDNI